jgi:hypothetical protein
MGGSSARSIDRRSLGAHRAGRREAGDALGARPGAAGRHKPRRAREDISQPQLSPLSAGIVSFAERLGEALTLWRHDPGFVVPTQPHALRPKRVARSGGTRKGQGMASGPVGRR